MKNWVTGCGQLREDVELVDGVHGELKVNDYLAG